MSIALQGMCVDAFVRLDVDLLRSRHGMCVPQASPHKVRARPFAIVFSLGDWRIGTVLGDKDNPPGIG